MRTQDSLVPRPLPSWDSLGIKLASKAGLHLGGGGGGGG